MLKKSKNTSCLPKKNIFFSGQKFANSVFIHKYTNVMKCQIIISKCYHFLNIVCRRTIDLSGLYLSRLTTSFKITVVLFCTLKILCFVSVLLQEKFSAEQTVVELAELLPATDYSVTLYALYEEDPSDPVTAVATTCKIFPKLCLPLYSSFPIFFFHLTPSFSIFFSFLLLFFY